MEGRIVLDSTEILHDAFANPGVDHLPVESPSGSSGTCGAEKLELRPRVGALHDPERHRRTSPTPLSFSIRAISRNRTPAPCGVGAGRKWSRSIPEPGRTCGAHPLHEVLADEKCAVILIFWKNATEPSRRRRGTGPSPASAAMTAPERRSRGPRHWAGTGCPPHAPPARHRHCS